MIKKFIKYFLYLLILLTIGVIYLSYFGVETKRFNQLIKDEVLKTNEKIKIELEEVKIILNLNDFSIGLKTNATNLIYENKIINLEKIGINFSIQSFLKKEFAIKNAKIATAENSLKDIIKIARTFQNTPQLFIFNTMVKGGVIIADIDLNFNDKGKLTDNYNIQGTVRDAKIRLLNKKNINKIRFNFNIKDKQYLLENSKIEYQKLKLSSKKIKISKQKQYYLFEGDLSSPKSSVNSDLFLAIFKNNFEDLGFRDLNFSSENNFFFKLDKKLKFSDVNIKSRIELKKLNYKKDYINLKKYLPNYNNSFELNDHKIELTFNKSKLSIKGKGKFLIDKNADEINYNINFKNGDYNFKSKIQFKNNPLQIKIFDYKKDENKNSLLEIDGLFKKNKTIIFKNISFKESKNKFLINDLSLNKNFKINHINRMDLDFLNENKKKNKISLKKNKKNYEILGKNFDGSILLNKMLKSDNKDGVSGILNNFNSSVKFSIDQTYIDNSSYLNGLNGSLKFLNNNLVNLNLEADFADNKKLTFTIKTNENNEKITTLFSGYPKPLIKRYKFIKGFEEGVLDFHSIKKNNVSKSVLKIDNFKVKEVPVLAKLLTLASLQGIADLLTGEGIRFTDFEMIFSNKDKLMTIDEIYAIGPAISIMMDGYIESEKLISLRGTLVPATTINRSIASIPLIGNILVGKKVGEGIFGVSFKIKGSPKDLKTTVNPIKTLTPRFITRTLEKIKKTN